MAPRVYDAVIIGTGQAGPTLASKLAANGYKTAIIERGPFGGSCVNYGCTPTKAMVASARAAYMAREAGRWGVVVNGDVSIDVEKVYDRKNEIVLESRNGLRGWLESIDNLDIIEGDARFVSPTQVQVEGHDQIQGERFYINVGARPRVPDIPGLDSVNYMTNHDILALREIPEHLVIVGGSYIGLEFGQMFRRFGADVTIIERADHVANKEDVDVSEEIARILEAEGITLRTQAECIGLEPGQNGGVHVRVVCKKGGPDVQGTHLLLATGRVPNTDTLGIAAAGLQTDARGYITVNDALQTNHDHIWALGDVNGRGAFTHTSYNDHEIMADHIFGDGTRHLSDRFLTYGMFIDPPLGRVGMTEAQARATGRPLLLGKMMMSSVSRAKERSETSGLMKVVIDAETERFLGATVLGIGGDEIIHTITDQMYADAPYTVIRDAVHIHPTVSELIPTMLQQLERVE
jgi:pyruvate/2-oxoglutarate dehydrogenase complex dihydrolipoamide dehydrogenase (E3) component